MLAVIRHGDRTPKQKMKMKVTQEPLLALLHKHLDSKGKQAKLKVGGLQGWLFTTAPRAGWGVRMQGKASHVVYWAPTSCSYAPPCRCRPTNQPPAPP